MIRKNSRIQKQPLRKKPRFSLLNTDSWNFFHKSSSKKKTILSLKTGFLAIALCVITVKGFQIWSDRQIYSKELLSNTIGREVSKGIFPQEWRLFTGASTGLLTLVQYTIRQDLQNRMNDLFERYRPDYGSFVAIEAETGKILTLTSYSKDENMGNLALQANFPAASVFKIITASAAIDQKLVSSETVIPFNGRSNTLYRRNVFQQETNRWTRFMTLREAFGRSVNTIFGKLGLFYLGPSLLEDYAGRFGFNGEVSSDLPLEIGQTEIGDKNDWEIVEAASGFTLKNTLSPLHGALIAATIANDGVMMEPYLVKSLYSENGEKLYDGKPSIANRVVSPITAEEVKSLMEETVQSGTSRGTFRSFLRSPKFKKILVGGKTGSLTGIHPRGKCDWFVGFANYQGKKIAVAALTVHKKYWTVKSAYLARKFIESYYLENERKIANR